MYSALTIDVCVSFVMHDVLHVHGIHEWGGVLFCVLLRCTCMSRGLTQTHTWRMCVARSLHECQRNILIFGIHASKMTLPFYLNMINRKMCALLCDIVSHTATLFHLAIGKHAWEPAIFLYVSLHAFTLPTHHYMLCVWESAALLWCACVATKL